MAARTWPRWLAGGMALLLVAVLGVFWAGVGPRLLLGVTGALVALRGALPPGRPAAVRAGAAVAGLGAVAVALLSAPLTGWVLLVGVPAGLLAGALVLLSRGGTARRSGQAALIWWALVAGLLVVTGVLADWGRAADGAAVVAALAVGLLGVSLVVGSGTLRAAARRPAPPARPAACAGCACSAGGCGALG
ncbi:hypothetical protein GCU56_04315 [Geodermatophilus sabuli]|uniref:Uncharacterized protein n=1 Tax=Geodermatophilus sabuli TaxID=1564158 RepID=A0A7K3VWS4_9ACTN|nr:hypothetical protein [Geodermatophilus sabuli]NEK57096.1 hypothetical protein [Geodermatophilus sabuli]